MSPRHYLDHASTSPLRPEAVAAIAHVLELGGASGDGIVPGDPGRLHAEGRVARDLIERAREQVAELCGCAPNRIVFTSGATESANTAVFAATRARPAGAVVSTAVEHSCVREASRRWAGGGAVDVAVDAVGRVELAHLDELLAEGEVALVNCQYANHEVGTVQPVAEVVARGRRAQVPVHVDAALAVGHEPLDLDALGADLVSISAHKLGGPSGVGALYVRRSLRLEPLLLGGEQERGRRGGLENLVGIVGFGAAAGALAADGQARLVAEATDARRRTEALVAAALDVDGVEQLGDPVRRLPQLVCVAVTGVLAEAVLLGLDRAGVAAHSGSACSSEAIEPSPVLAAMGADPDRSLRLSVGWSTTDGDVAALAAALGPVVERLRALGAA